MGRIRNSYTSKEKLAAVRYAEAHGNRAAGREFNVSESSVRDWRRQKDVLQRQKTTCKALRGRHALFPGVEKRLLEFVMTRRNQGIGVSTFELHVEAKKIAKSESILNFKASLSWVYKFLHRNNLSIRRRTHVAQKLPEDYEEKITDFQRFIIQLRKKNKYDLSQIGNADQNPLTFDLPTNTTVNVKGTRCVSLTTTGNEKNRFTVMLACTADGGKLPPYVVFKRKTLPKTTVWPKGIVVRCQEKGWMDQALVHDWVKNVWQKRPGALSKKSLLVLDAFRAHRAEDVKTRLADSRTTLAVIPGGMTSILQPLDVSVNKPMKTLLQRKWTDWYAGDEHTYTSSGRMRKPELDQICSWIVDAWEEFDPEIIRRAFKKCSISNNLDGTEDDILFEEFVSHAKSDEAETEADGVDTFYTDKEITDVEFFDYFGNSDDEEDFEGFDEDDLPLSCLAK